VTRAVVLHVPAPDRWREALTPHLPDVVIVDLDHAPADEVEAAIVWKYPIGALDRFPNLRLVQSFGHGVDFLAADPGLRDVTVAKLVDPGLTIAMARYVAHAALEHSLLAPRFRANQAARAWKPKRIAPPGVAAVLGLGAIGSEIARVLDELGFEVRGWTRSPSDKPFAHSAGYDALSSVIAGAEVVVNVLPLTDETRGVCNAGFFASMEEGSLFVNVGRGGTVVEEDLLVALDAGRPSHATLDVTVEEPLPEDSPLWAHPAVTLTPHVSGLTDLERSASLMAANVRRALDGETPHHLVDLERGY
jgi:glyoxylate/hydroxypyruvate reductase A